MSREERTAPAWPRAPRRPPTTRYTIDLEHRHRDSLRARAQESGTTASAIVRALLDLVEDDPALAGRLAETTGQDRGGVGSAHG
jgi:hypothetical protein